jgi:hypothetical protein
LWSEVKCAPRKQNCALPKKRIKKNFLYNSNYPPSNSYIVPRYQEKIYFSINHFKDNIGGRQSCQFSKPQLKMDLSSHRIISQQKILVGALV